MHDDILTIGGKRLSDFQCWHDGSQVFRRASKQIEKYSIPGRSGDLVFNLDRHENLIIPFNCFIKENFRENYTALMDYLNNLDGYVELRTTEEPNHFREALFHASTEPQMNPFNQSGQFTLEFDCKPQLWLDDGQRQLVVPNSGLYIYNPTYSPAYPIFIFPDMATGYIMLYDSVEGRLIPKGNIRLNENIGTTYIEVLNENTVDAYVIDSNGVTSSANSNIYIYGPDKKNFRLMPGKTRMNVSNQNIKVQPRWYRL